MEAAHDVIHFRVIVSDTEVDSINVPSEGHKDFKVWRMRFSVVPVSSLAKVFFRSGADQKPLASEDVVPGILTTLWVTLRLCHRNRL